MKKRTIVGWITLLALVLGMAIAVAQEPPPAAAAAPAGEPSTPPPAPAAKKMTLWDLIVVGGWAMWPLGACSFGLIMMVTINYRQINRKRMMPPTVVTELKDAARRQDVQKLWDLSNAVKCLFTNSLAAGLRKINLDDPAASKGSMEESIAEAVTREEALAGYWLSFLSLITAIAPMLGLLGTVSGMIGAFQQIAGGGMGKPELLAGNIGEALITTAAGLIIAIPSMFFYFLARNRLNAILQTAEKDFSTILEDLTGTGIAQSAFDEAPAEEAAEDKP